MHGNQHPFGQLIRLPHRSACSGAVIFLDDDISRHSCGSCDDTLDMHYLSENQECVGCRSYSRPSERDFCPVVFVQRPSDGFRFPCEGDRLSLSLRLRWMRRWLSGAVSSSFCFVAPEAGIPRKNSSDFGCQDPCNPCCSHIGSVSQSLQSSWVRVCVALAGSL